MSGWQKRADGHWELPPLRAIYREPNLMDPLAIHKIKPEHATYINGDGQPVVESADKRYVWFSICSAHKWFNSSCSGCCAGQWMDSAALSLEHEDHPANRTKARGGNGQAGGPVS